MNGLLLRSMNENIPVEMIYMSESKQISQRIITVTSINGSTIRAYCFLRKQSRLFKIDNILSVMPIKNTRREIG